MTVEHLPLACVPWYPARMAEELASELAAGRIAALYRHPVKGFTPEPLMTAELVAGAHFPDDRLYAVEVGPSGFDPDRPAHISKQRFAVLARIAEVAMVRSAYDDGVFAVTAVGHAPLAADLRTEAGRGSLADWLTEVLDLEPQEGPLKVLAAPQGHRFMDSPRGMVSVLNLASVRDLESRVGQRLDPLRFRANVHVEGWPAWIEMTPGLAGVTLGGAACTTVKPTIRCVATHVNPVTGERDIDLLRAMFDHYGHTFCGLYLEVARGGGLAVGDVAGSLQ